MKLDFTKLIPSGKCEICTISLWKELDDKPAIFPCYTKDCPYMKKVYRKVKGRVEPVLMIEQK